MKLNTPQRIVLCLGGIVILGMLIYPPWVARIGQLQMRAYGPITDPPKGFGQVRPGVERGPVEIDAARLGVQCLAVVVATCLVVAGLGATRHVKWNRAQKTALLLGALVCVAMLLYPPWEESGQKQVQGSHYSALWRQPMLVLTDDFLVWASRRSAKLPGIQADRSRVWASIERLRSVRDGPRLLLRAEEDYHEEVRQFEAEKKTRDWSYGSNYTWLRRRKDELAAKWHSLYVQQGELKVRASAIGVELPEIDARMLQRHESRLGLLLKPLDSRYLDLSLRVVHIEWLRQAPKAGPMPDGIHATYVAEVGSPAYEVWAAPWQPPAQRVVVGAAGKWRIDVQRLLIQCLAAAGLAALAALILRVERPERAKNRRSPTAHGALGEGTGDEQVDRG